MVTCALALAIMAQVSACNHVFRKESTNYTTSRERVRMGLGVLKALETYWGLAKRSVNEVKKIARQLLTDKMVVFGGSSDDGGSREIDMLSAGAEFLDTSNFLY
jgi:hypothetical protein